MLVVKLTASERTAEGLPPKEVTGEKLMVSVQLVVLAREVVEVQSPGAGLLSGKSVGKLSAEKSNEELP